MSRQTLILGVLGTVLVAAAVVCGRAAKDATIVLPALAAASAAFIAVIAVLGKRATPIGRRDLVGLALIGLAARVVLVVAPPVLEDDVNRYLWDGAVLASGHSPYAYSPQEVYDARLGRPLPDHGAAARAELAELAELSRSSDLDAAFSRINYPSVPTIYPPLSEAVFAGLALAWPGELVAMKIALVAFDAVTALALLAILATVGAPRRHVLLYWWNPLVILSFAGSAHMDALPMALLTVSIALLLRGRSIAGGLLLGLAASAKLFPLVCWPGLARKLGVRGTVAAALITIAGVMVLWHPRMFEGLIAFASLWQINGAVHALLAAIVGSSIARVVAGVLVVAVTLAFARREPLTAVTIALAALVVASPAVNPWYVAWLVPLAAVNRSLPLLALSITVLLSYVRFIESPLPVWLVLLEFGIPLATLALVHRGWWRERQHAEIK